MESASLGKAYEEWLTAALRAFAASRLERWQCQLTQPRLLEAIETGAIERATPTSVQIGALELQEEALRVINGATSHTRQMHHGGGEHRAKLAVRMGTLTVARNSATDSDVMPVEDIRHTQIRCHNPCLEWPDSS